MLVLDNLEQVLEAAPLLVDLLSTVASLRLVTTSRAALHVRGEREYVVGPLPFAADAEMLSPADLARSPAVRLFVERVREVQPDFRLTTANGAVVAGICRRLDGLPLALELAAPWMKVLTAEALFDRLGRDVLRSPAVPRDLPERQRTMNATVAWSYELLDADEQRAFRRFGVLPGLFPIEAAAAVLAGHEERTSAESEALRAVAGLIDKSLLIRAEVSAATTRALYQMLETVRSYAGVQLIVSNEQDDATQGLLRYCATEASLAAAGLIGHAQVQWLNRVREDLESYRAALAWLIERGRPAEAADIAWGLMFFWLIRGHAAEGLRWYEQILRLPALPAAAESKALVGAALMWYAQGELAQARTELTRARALAAGSAVEREVAAQAENMLGHVEHASGNMQAAAERFTRSHAEFRTLGAHWGAGHTLSGMAWVALATGDLVNAERLLDEATSELQHVGPWFLSLTRYLRALLAVRRGSPDQAIEWVRDSLTHIRQLHDKFAFVYALVPLASAAALKGDHAWAARILGARDAVSESTGATVVDESARNLCEQVAREAREYLGPGRWALAYAAGRRTSIDFLLNEIDSVV
jgi:predicted ATPase